MYSSNTIENQKLSSTTPTGHPLPFSQPPAIGIPANQLHGNIQAPRPIHRQANTVPWFTGLFDCCDDVPNCCITCCCPCITFGQISEIVDEGSPSGLVNGTIYSLVMSLTCCSCIYSYFYRSKLRQKYSLEESPCDDCLVHFCCESCALCQEYRELKSRGFDMAIGWEGNVERQNHGVAMAPIVQGGMTR